MTAPKRLVAIASAGGHFNQLLLLRSSYAHLDVTYLTTLPGLAEQFGATPSALVPDCNADTPLRALRAAVVIFWRLLRLRPQIVISTGALPGVFAILAGRILGAHTIWVDSVANGEVLSSSGRLARKIAHLTLSQWPEVAAASGVRYEGSVL
ncbi:MAG: UDP-N-acetylglucosamine--LPS N-acetylglucosamine transferase [Paracoccaceae bacterium]